MPIKAKYNGSYKDITGLMNVDESIDYVLAKTSSSYKRVYTATRSIEDTPPTTFKSIKPGANLTDYRIYGQTSRNLFDAEIVQGSFNSNTGVFRNATNRIRSNETDFIYLAPGKYTINADGVDDIVYCAYSSEDTSTFLYYQSKTSWQSLPCTFTVHTPCYFLFGFRFSDDSDIIPSAISNIMLNSGTTNLPYEPYGESVGDRTANLFDKNDPDILEGYEIRGTNIVVRRKYFVTNFISVNAETSYITNGPDMNGFSSGVLEYDSSKQLIRRNPNSSFDGFTTTNTTAYIKLNCKIEHKDTCMIVKGNTAPSIYEPYGYKVPVTVSNGTDTLTTPIYLPEQIRKVGDEAEYIDYGEQKQHRVRKNLLKNTATSQTIDGVTFTVNSDRSVTCNGTANNVVLYEICSIPRFSGECILSGCPMGGSQNTYRLQYTNLRDLSYKDYGTSVNIYQFDEIQYPTSKINIRIEKGYTCNNLTFYPMIRNADITDDTYEPYIENTEVDVTLPALPTVTGANTLSVGTEVQPSKIDITGHIKNIPEVTS